MAKQNVDDSRGDLLAIDLWRLPTNFFSLSQNAQYDLIAKATRKAEKISTPREPCTMSKVDEALGIMYLFTILGVPLYVPLVTCIMAVARSRHLRWWLPTVGLLALHPIPSYSTWFRRNRIGVILAKYFSVSFLVHRSDPECQHIGTAGVEAAPVQAPVVSLACPHGVLNFGALVYVFFSRWIYGLEQYTAGASIISNVPGLRYMTHSAWVVPADRKRMKKCLQEPPRLEDAAGRRHGTEVPRRGGKLGVVPDGIAGIFHSEVGKDVLFIGKKRGLMRICLEEGALILGGWFSGTSDMFRIVTDPFGIMEAMSRKLKVSVFLFFGRWGLPIPRRVPITLCSTVVRCPKLAAPTDEEVDQLHNEVYGGLSKRFQYMRHYCGHPDRELVVV